MPNFVVIVGMKLGKVLGFVLCSLSPHFGIRYPFNNTLCRFRFCVVVTFFFWKCSPFPCRENLFWIILVNILASDTPTFLYLFNRHGLHMGMDACFVTMHIKADDILFSPFLTCKAVGVQCPVIDAFLQYNLAVVSIWI